MLADSDPVKAKRAFDPMLEMTKIDSERWRRAYDRGCPNPGG
jgi:hypothetical protein